MEKLAIILMRPPYGNINAAEAIRHALGAVSDGLEVSLLMVDGGTHLARKGQEEEGSGLTNLGSALKDCVDMDVAVYADKLSLRQEHLDEKDLVEGVKVVNSTEAGELVSEADCTMIF